MFALIACCPTLNILLQNDVKDKLGFFEGVYTFQGFSDGMDYFKEELGDNGGLEPLLNETESCSEAGTSSSNDDGIVLMVDDWVLS